jgi:hypothetical protein
MLRHKKVLAIFLILVHMYYNISLIVTINNKLKTNNSIYRASIKKPPISNKEKIRLYVKDDYISESIYSNTKYPLLLAAIAKVESNYRPQIRGDGGDSHGLFQIQPHHWGYVPEAVPAQVIKCDRIFRELERRHGYYGAIKHYNGSGRGAEAYRRRVLDVKKEIEKTEVRYNAT